jgi:sulfur-oxidizing protein SoxY
MEFTRRQTLIAGLGAAAAAALPIRAFALDAPMVGTLEEFTGGAATGTGDITLNAPEIAENGNTVPIDVTAPGAAEIRIYALGNPTPGVAAVTFGPLAASHMASTRIRLAGTQEVLAVAKMPDGSFISASKEVKVTIGGCGG